MTESAATFTNPGEDELIHVIRQYAQLTESVSPGTAGWRHPSQYHLLLEHGRRFTAMPSPPDLVGMPDRLCYSNAARYARAHRSEGLLYAEGLALTHEGLDFHLPHAWVVRSDGAVLDPTWNDAPGRAYIGVAVTDMDLWPYDGGGLLSDFERALPLMRDGIPDGVLADVGRPL
ncbi:hypothetical protein KV205_19310 [Streptomyces sp. SKN60]|uniref:hypothetical protein n=1 Tax=Streptomyces sp. SKN60 TaxID=2855506 RepID=UPI0022469C5F|nr:hypothetical protein [Streptomyces sp. SKN60]MCX2182661.1 hypothetical protein [Streptomyces sp. SKN60]